MADFWGDVRADVMRRLNDHYPDVPFEERVMIAEDAAREAEDQAKRFGPQSSVPSTKENDRG